jgi:hypothetical protein
MIYIYIYTHTHTHYITIYSPTSIHNCFQYLPRETLHATIGDKDTLILQAEHSLRLTKCKIVTSQRYDHGKEKHLTTGWYNFINENNIKPGDRLVFTFNQSTIVMRVKIERPTNN